MDEDKENAYKIIVAAFIYLAAIGRVRTNGTPIDIPEKMIEFGKKYIPEGNAEPLIDSAFVKLFDEPILNPDYEKEKQ